MHTALRWSRRSTRMLLVLLVRLPAAAAYVPSDGVGPIVRPPLCEDAERRLETATGCTRRYYSAYVLTVVHSSSVYQTLARNLIFHPAPLQARPLHAPSQAPCYAGGRPCEDGEREVETATGYYFNKIRLTALQRILHFGGGHGGCSATRTRLGAAPRRRTSSKMPTPSPSRALTRQTPLMPAARHPPAVITLPSSQCCSARMR
ncbi:hypothetical protein HYPSUDRAFT_89662 [Hypholoma sublateritium FD-334 SS-4]|uniref:Uncharacterized protein n=1 Tax=Hypholoma sublateritium (strain FD-334 SS-4) TaxID=945553 RepID=A0A0D2NJE2_HYPSF|nr:hypothetical protein HYPSUDRAFT_89662 [Hypholoma sublateritium FD-334 SS-4]